MIALAVEASMTTNTNGVASPRSIRAVQTLRRTLAEIGWEPESSERTTNFFVDFGPPHLPVADALAAITPGTERFLFYVNFGAAAPPRRRDEVARFITLANWALTIGNFEMDYDDGHVRFKSSVDFEGVELSEALIRNTILPAMHAVETYADSLMAVLANGKDARQAMKDVSRR
jgi:hypothetical protein